MYTTNDQLESWFIYHPPSPEQVIVYQELREKAKELAYFIRDNVPEGPDQTAALRKLRECVMTANSGIACA